MHYEKFQDGTVKCIEDEIPFEIPNSWAWTRICSIATVKGGKRIPKGMTFSNKETNHAYIRVIDMKNDTVNLSNLKYIDDNVFETIQNYIVSKDDLYITIAGTIGVVGEIPLELDGMNLTENAAKISAIEIEKSYLCLVLQSAYCQKQFHQKTYQVAMPKLGLERICSTLIPMCSLKTQKQILEYAKTALSSVNFIEKSKNSLANSILCTKSKILDLAIRGKLVPQDPNEEPASVLLERIQAEKEELIKQGKIKRDKNDSVIFKGDDNSYYEKMGNKVTCIDDEINFEIPESWMWVRLGTLFMHNTGKALNSSNTEGTELPYITTSNVYWDGFELSNLKSMCFSESEIEKCTVVKGDLLVCEGGDIGRSAIWNFDEPIRIQNHIHRLRAYLPLQTELYYYFMYLYKRNGMITGNGIGLQGLSSKLLHSIIVPLPPINEQKNITTKIKVLFKNLQTMEQSFI